ncbi:recombinase RecU [Bacillus anthracis]|nr:recombinase RecU [Bacillus anthracis]PGV41807.1 recombinase RecU [Bacillus anthracis]
MGLGNRGMVFEMLINLANEMYQRGGVALIDKCPTPVKVLFSNFPCTRIPPPQKDKIIEENYEPYLTKQMIGNS